MPMKTIELSEVESHLSQLVDSAAAGEPFVIARAGRPLVKVVPAAEPHAGEPRRLGFLKGQLVIPDDLDRLGEDDVQGLFEGR